MRETSLNSGAKVQLFFVMCKYLAYFLIIILKFHIY